MPERARPSSADIQSLGSLARSARMQIGQSSIAVIGCGYWGKNMVRNFAKLGALAVCCDATPEGRATAAELAPQSRIVADLKEALDAEIAGVVIATPAETHYEVARSALKAGKDVFVEKPLS